MKSNTVSFSLYLPMAFSRQIDYHKLISEGASSSYIAYDPCVKYLLGWEGPGLRVMLQEL